MRNFLDSVELSDLIESVDGWRESSVETEDLTLDDGCQRKVIEEFGKLLPDVGVSVLSQALVIETISKSNHKLNPI